MGNEIAKMIEDAFVSAAKEKAEQIELKQLRALVKGIQDALGTGEEGGNLVAVARDAAHAEMELAARIRKDDEDYDMGRDTATLLAERDALAAENAKLRGQIDGLAGLLKRALSHYPGLSVGLANDISAALKSCGEE